MSLPEYSDRFLDPAEAEGYRTKFQKSWLRRVSARREARLVGGALDAALAWLTARDGLPATDRTLLDLPAGAGRFAPLAAGRVGRYLAGDRSPAMLALTRRALADNGLTDRLIGVMEGDARQLDLPADHVDLALCIRLLHHFPDRDDRIAILSELRRVSRGPLVTTFLDRTAPKQRRHLARLARRGGSTRRVLVTPDQWHAEATTAGWHTEQTWHLSAQFSGHRVVLCTPQD